MKTRTLDTTCLEEFIGVSRDLHHEDPQWVPPLEDPLRFELTRPFLRMFLCERSGRPLGRLAAIVEPRLPNVGQLGYVELAHDPDVLPSLLAQAEPWLRAQGATELWATSNGAAHLSHRLLTRGFEREPFLFEPRNPPHVPRAFLAAGFQPLHTWRSYSLPRARVLTLRQRLSAVLSRADQRYQATPLEPGDPDTMPRLHRLLDRVWEGHVGYVSMDLAEFQATYGGILALDPYPYLGVLTRDGEDVGLGLCYPDYVAEVRALNGAAAGWGSWIGSNRTTRSRPPRLVMHTVAMVPGARTGGAPWVYLLDFVLGQALDEGYEEIVAALVTEEFRSFRREQAACEYQLLGRSL